VASAAEMKVCYIPPTASVFGAFGASTLDIVHKYEKSRHLRFFDYATATYSNEYDTFNSIVSELRNQAVKDIILEGFSEEQAIFRLELEMRYGAQWRYTHIESPVLSVHSQKDVEAICNFFTEEFKRLYGAEAAFPEAGIEVETFRLFVTCKLPHFSVGKSEKEDEIPSAKALKEEKDCYWEARGSFQKTPVYDWDLLKPGNQLKGPAIIEAKTTTVVVEPEWFFQMDAYGNGILKK
jgi:N-methylhydantoinase A